jgi:hypothetical protein
MGGFPDQDLSGFCFPGQPRGQIDDGAHQGEIRVFLGVRPAEIDLASIDPYSHPPSWLFSLFAYLDGGSDGQLRVALVSHCSSKDAQDPPSQDAVDLSSVSGHAIVNHVQETVRQRSFILGTDTSDHLE